MPTDDRNSTTSHSTEAAALSVLRAAVRTDSAIAWGRTVTTRGSTPRDCGSIVVVGADGAVTGNVSGGCVEADIAARAADLVVGGQRYEKVCYGDDENGLGVGLLCGGEIDVLIETLDPRQDRWLAVLLDAIDEALDESVLVTTLTGGRIQHTVLYGHRPAFGEPLSQGFADRVRDTVRAMRESDVEAVTLVDAESETVVHRFSARRPRIIAVGANDFSRELGILAQIVGYNVVVCDQRPSFARAECFPGAQVVCAWPQEYLRDNARRDDIVCVLTHDEKVDVPALLAAGDVGCRYIGAMGSRRTHASRVARLSAAGWGADRIASLHSPIGLDLGARGPSESALSILAEMVAERRGRTGRPLAETNGPIRALSAIAEDVCAQMAAPSSFAPGKIG